MNCYVCADFCVRRAAAGSQRVICCWSSWVQLLWSVLSLQEMQVRGFTLRYNGLKLHCLAFPSFPTRTLLALFFLQFIAQVACYEWLNMFSKKMFWELHTFSSTDGLFSVTQVSWATQWVKEHQPLVTKSPLTSPVRTGSTVTHRFVCWQETHADKFVLLYWVYKDPWSLYQILKLHTGFQSRSSTGFNLGLKRSDCELTWWPHPPWAPPSMISSLNLGRSEICSVNWKQPGEIFL